MTPASPYGDANLEERVDEMQQAILQMQRVLAVLLARAVHPPVQLVVDELQAERLEFHMGGFTVGNLSGQLNVGMTHVAESVEGGDPEGGLGDAASQAEGRSVDWLWPPPPAPEEEAE